MSVVDHISLVLAVLAGGAFGLLFPQFRKRYLHLLMSFSGAYLLSITALHVLPEAFAEPSTPPGLAILAGFFLQVLFEQLSTGVEHGHVHVHAGARVAFPVLLGLCLHALLEGSPLALIQDAVHVGHDHNHLLSGIILHKIPAAFALSMLLSHSGYKNRTIWFLLGVFALMSPLGAVLAEAFIPERIVPYLLGLVSGSLLHVGTTILFELDDADNHRLTPAKTAAIVSGIVIALLTAYV